MIPRPHLSIRHKLLLAFGAVLILVGALAFYGVRQVSDAGTMVVRLYDSPLMAVSYTRSAHAKFNDVRARMERAVGLSDIALSDDVRGMDASVEDLLADLAVVRSRVGNRGLLAALVTAEARIRDWHSTATRVLRPPGEGLTEVPTHAVITEKAGLASAALDDAVEMAAAYGFEFRSLAEATMAAAKGRMIALALATALVGVLFSLLITRSISGPVHEAMMVAGRIAAGDLSDTIRTRRRDEMGRLLLSLKEMQASLRAKRELEHAMAEIKERAHIQEVTQKDEELRRTKVFLDTVVENIPAMLFVKQAQDRRFVLLNRAGEKLLGVARQEVIGKTDHDLFPQEQAEFIFMRDSEVLSSGRLETVEEEQVHTLSRGIRLLRTKKIAVADETGNPQYLLGVSEDITEQKQAEAQIAHMAHHDALTDLPNRAAFNDYLAVVLERAAGAQSEFTVLCIDLDGFKEVNDIFGHPAGDALLREVAQRFRASAEGAFLSRVGGDEFTLLCEDGHPYSKTAALADRLMSAASEEVEIDGRRVLIGVSIGIAVFPRDGTDATSLLANADAALYQAKADGRGVIRWFRSEMQVMLRERRALQQDLRDAMEANALRLHYQPQARMDGTITGFEALVRWFHPGRGWVPPNTFIPIAEESGLILKLGEWVLREACREAASWSTDLHVAVNISPVQFRHGDLANQVHEILLETGLSPGRLELEVTEGVLIGDFSRAVSILNRLKALGVSIAMDDFGTGYSSLSYLQAFPFDKIKIDRTFISNVERRPHSAAIVRAVIGLARGLELPIVAEGVETAEEARFLADEACDEMQGHLIGRPKAIEEYSATVGKDVPEEQKLARRA